MDPVFNSARNNDNQGDDSLYELIQSIQNHTEFNHETFAFRIIETHISYVLLTGRYAYKFKKPVNLGFLDFRSLKKRKHFCDEELRLNRRLAPELYLDVVSFTGTVEKPVLNGSGPVLEYAVRMVQFDGGDEALALLRDGKLTPDHIDQLARQIAEFHLAAVKAVPDSEFGTPHSVQQDVMDNFKTLRPILSGDAEYNRRLDWLQSWTDIAFAAIRLHLDARKRDGYIRECHGDLHLGNIVRHLDQLVIFDCIEFSPPLRWIDVINDLAFLVMDLHGHDEPGLAQRLLNGYLQHTGDYEGLRILRYFLVYRALVRSKVAGIRLGQPHLVHRDIDYETVSEHRYLDLACSYARPADPVLVITHGLSGSGKTTVSRQLSDKMPAIWIRSDIERKRLHGLHSTERSFSGLQEGIYAKDSTAAVYQRLAGLTEIIIQSGYSVIVDAAFLQKQFRQNFYRLASGLKIPFFIIDLYADKELLKTRVKQRCRMRGDASEADIEVLDYQLRSQEPLDELETGYRVALDSTMAISIDKVIADLTGKAARSARPVAGSPPWLI